MRYMFQTSCSVFQAIALYWTVSNLLSLATGQILKIPRVREYFKIPKQLPTEVLKKQQKPKKKFVEGFKDSKFAIQCTNNSYKKSPEM